MYSKFRSLSYVGFKYEFSMLFLCMDSVLRTTHVTLFHAGLMSAPPHTHQDTRAHVGQNQLAGLDNTVGPRPYGGSRDQLQ